MSEPVWVPLGAGGIAKAVYPIDFRNPNVGGLPGNVYPLVTALTLWEPWAWAFSATASGVVYGYLRLPENLPTPATASIKLDLMAATAGDVRVQIEFVGIADGESLNISAWAAAPAQQTVTLAALRVLKRAVWAGVQIPTHVAPGELCIVKFARLGADAADTNASPLELLHGALVID